MAKWGEPSDETINEITEVLIATGLDNLINTKIIVNDDQKPKVIVPRKMSADIKFAFNYDLRIIVNETILDELPPLQKRQCIEEALSGVNFDVTNEKLTVGQPDIKTFHGFLKKYSYDQYEVLEESIKSLFDNQKNSENAEN